MQIAFKIDDFLFALFPKLMAGNNHLIISRLWNCYTFGNSKPEIEIEGDWVKIRIDTDKVLNKTTNFNKIIELCEQRQFAAAKPLLQNLIQKDPANSEYYRIMGQIYSDEGDQDEAINYLIDALRWNPKNGWALLLMRNIFAKFKDDIPTAMKYYDQALVVNPEDNITINNISANLMQQGKLKEAKKYFQKALKINDQYPHTLFAMGMIAEAEDNLQEAFDYTIQAIKFNKSQDVLYQNTVKQAIELAQKIIITDAGEKILESYKNKLESEGGKKIEEVKDEKIPTAAKLEFAEIYHRENHIVRYKPDYLAVEHLIMHELVHLDFAIQAGEQGANQLFTSHQSNRSQFIKGLDTTIKKLQKMNIDQASIDRFCSGLFDGINSQAYNTPIDLFIEQFLYNTFTDLRPYQFISLYTLIQQGRKAVTDKRIFELSPKSLVSKSKIYNLVNALQFKNLYGVDFIEDFEATKYELNQAEEFYQEYQEYKDDREPGEEYKLVQHWTEDLKLDQNFELVNETKRSNDDTDIDQLLASIEKDPFGMETDIASKNRKMDQFLKSQKGSSTNMPVVLYMVDALQFFEGKTKDGIKKIAFEIAMSGTQGYSPDKDGYSVSSIPGKTFLGYHILAYYYVSWTLAIPEMLAQLQLPYDEEYKIAQTLYQKGNT